MQYVHKCSRRMIPPSMRHNEAVGAADRVRRTGTKLIKRDWPLLAGQSLLIAPPASCATLRHLFELFNESFSATSRDGL